MRLVNLCLLYIGLMVCIVWTTIASILAAIIPYFYPPFGILMHRLWCQGLLWIMGVKVNLIRPEQMKAHTHFIIAPNHLSYVDIFLIGALPLNFHWIAKQQVAKIPIMGWAYKAMGHYLVSRQGKGSDLNVMRNVENEVRNGESICMFPEGTRSRSGELLPFKKGAFKTAQNTGAPLLPIGIIGSREIAPPHTLPKKWGHKVTLAFGDLYWVSKEANIGKSMEEYREIMLSLINNNKSL